jgi:CBS domain-containing protein
MSPDVVTVTGDTLVEDAAKQLREKGVESLVVVDNYGRADGILTSTDFVTVVARSEPKAETPVERYTTREVVGVGPQDPVWHAADTVVTDGISHLPVVDDADGVVGMLSTTDLTASLSGTQEVSPA